MQFNQLVLASNNPGKIKEFTHIFAKLDIELIPQNKLNVPEINEPYSTFIENALHKARHCAKHTGLPSLADDSGICVNALNGMPGVLSARYAGEPKNEINNRLKLIETLKPYSDKTAYYYCLLVIVRYFNDPQPIFADGIIKGEVIEIPRGENGFGYDPNFYLPKLNKTMAELSSDKKNQISHRAIAIDSLISKIRLWLPELNKLFLSNNDA